MDLNDIFKTMNPVNKVLKEAFKDMVDVRVDNRVNDKMENTTSVIIVTKNCSYVFLCTNGVWTYDGWSIQYNGEP